MKLKNNALKELYDELVDCAISISPYVESPVEKAFRECDEKLSGSATFAHIKSLQDRNDILEKSNATLLSANLDLANKKRDLEKEINGLHKHMDLLSANEREALSEKKQLEKDLDNIKNQLNYCTHSRDNWRARAKYSEDEVKELKETLGKVNADRTELQKDRDSYHGLYTELRKDYDKLFEENKQISELRNDNASMHELIDIKNEELTATLKDYDKLNEENRKLKARADCHRYEVEWYRKHYKEQSVKELKRVNSNLQDTIQDLSIKVKEKERLDHMRDYLARFCEGRLCKGCPLESNEYKCGNGYSFRRRDQFDTRIISDEELERYYNKAWYGDAKHYKEQSDKVKELKKQLEELTSQYQKLTNNNKRLYNSVLSGYDQGQTDLWVALQIVNNSQPFELATCFPDVTGMEDILNWDLEDFLDAYKKWQEEKEKERLEHMRDYLARFCRGRLCSKCPLHTDNFKCEGVLGFNNILDEDLPRYYEKARGYGRRSFPIKDLASWECTLEATVEINKDLLEKVCGVKPEEGAHKLEYGDAVRLHWRDYDYMYIGPDEKEGALVRLFDPKNHAIVTTHIANVRYNGGKIILTNEDDLRMIWKDKK